MPDPRLAILTPITVFAAILIFFVGTFIIGGTIKPKIDALEPASPITSEEYQDTSDDLYTRWRLAALIGIAVPIFGLTVVLLYSREERPFFR